MPKIPDADPLRYGDLETFFSRLDHQSVWQRRVTFQHRVKPRHPRFLYKYLRFEPADAESIRRAADIIVESRLYLSDHESFNDPFDMKADVLFSGTMEEKRQRFKKIIDEKSTKQWKERQQELNRFMARPHEQWVANIRKILLKNTKETGVFSFAGDPRSILMWTHYGNSHRGLCLQFAVAQDPRIFAMPVPMKYGDEYPTLNWAKELQDQLDKPLISKHSGWRYEKEWRIIHPENAIKYLPFKPDALVSIISGCRSSEAEREQLSALLEQRASRKSPTVALYRAQQHANRYRLVLRRT